MTEFQKVGLLMLKTLPIWKKKERFLASKKGRPSTPSIVSENTALHPSHVSLTLFELVEKKLVVCLTPEQKVGKIYSLTKKGRDIVGQMKKMEE